MPRYRYVIALMLLVGCADPAATIPTADAATSPPDVASVASTSSCAAILQGPVLAGGGPLCKMSVTITISCPHGQAGRVFSIFGESSAPALYAAHADVGYQCGVPIELSRWGFPCTDGVAAEAGWWNPDGSGPNICTVTQI